jgi:phage/plasmid primase-like uncharacterized protein
MTYMTMEQQIASHLTFLREQHFAIEDLRIDMGFVRCGMIENQGGRGELCYKTQRNQLKNGMVGLATWCRGLGGETKTHKTYGLPFKDNSIHKKLKEDFAPSDRSEGLRKAELFWEMSDQTGQADYLVKKGVGYYGIRFRQSDYGKTAVVPMRDVAGKFIAYQLINQDGTKRFAKNVEIKGLMHMLHNSIDRSPIGLAESYTTAATCFELTGIAMVIAFSADNLRMVAISLREKFPDSPIIVFGDNDRHLRENIGAKAANQVKQELKTGCSIAIPEFNGYPASKEFTDWNDLVREQGIKETRIAICKALGK